MKKNKNHLDTVRRRGKKEEEEKGKTEDAHRNFLELLE